MSIELQSLAWWLTDKPIEEWLINGPFGTQVHSDNAHLLSDKVNLAGIAKHNSQLGQRSP